MEVQIIRRRKINGWGDHYGVLLSDNSVLENQFSIGIRRISLEEFSKNMLVTFEKKKKLTSEIYARITRLLQNKIPYDLLSYNCEHMANEVVLGDKYSSQINSLAFILALCGFVYVLDG